MNQKLPIIALSVGFILGATVNHFSVAKTLIDGQLIDVPTLVQTENGMIIPSPDKTSKTSIGKSLSELGSNNANSFGVLMMLNQKLDALISRNTSSTP